MPAPAQKINEYNREIHSWGNYVRPERLAFMVADCKRLLKQGAHGAGGIHALLGHLYARLNKPEESLHHYRNALHYHPLDMQIKACVGASLLACGQLQQALDALAEAATDKNLSAYDKVVVYANSAEALAKLGMTDDARSVMQEAIGFANHSDADTVIILAGQSAELGDDWEAVEFFARFCALRQNIPRGTLPAVAVIRAAPPSLLDLLDTPYLKRLGAAFEKISAHGDDCAPLQVPPRPKASGTSTAETALDVFHEMSPLRDEANAAVMDAGTHG